MQSGSTVSNIDEINMILAQQQEQFMTHHTHVGGSNIDDTHEKMLIKKA